MKRSEQRHKAYFLCGFYNKVSHSQSRPTGIEAEAEQSSGAVRLHRNTAGVQQGGSVRACGWAGVGGVN